MSPLPPSTLLPSSHRVVISVVGVVSGRVVGVGVLVLAAVIFVVNAVVIIGSGACTPHAHCKGERVASWWVLRIALGVASGQVGVVVGVASCWRGRQCESCDGVVVWWTGEGWRRGRRVAKRQWWEPARLKDPLTARRQSHVRDHRGRGPRIVGVVDAMSISISSTSSLLPSVPAVAAVLVAEAYRCRPVVVGGRDLHACQRWQGLAWLSCGGVVVVDLQAQLVIASSSHQPRVCYSDHRGCDDRGAGPTQSQLFARKDVGRKIIMEAIEPPDLAPDYQPRLVFALPLHTHDHGRPLASDAATTVTVMLLRRVGVGSARHCQCHHRPQAATTTTWGQSEPCATTRPRRGVLMHKLQAATSATRAMARRHGDRSSLAATTAVTTAATTAVTTTRTMTRRPQQQQQRQLCGDDDDPEQLGSDCNEIGGGSSWVAINPDPDDSSGGGRKVDGRKVAADQLWWQQWWLRGR
ncbi:hypothetical protein EDB85DRAFT_1897541 [Lactarius pseudohatsudake]|nr:hypothetical protein EDB85DRAFT_1897541 [Lactarius pseudohatsudake]